MLKAKLSRIAAVAAVSLASLATMAGSAHAAYTGTISSVLTPGDKVVVDNIMGQGFQGSVNAGYTSVDYLLYFFTQPAVLSVLVAIGLIYFGGGFALTWAKGWFKGRKGKKSIK